MTRRLIRKTKPATATPKVAPVAQVITPVQIAQASRALTPVTSMAFATQHDVELSNYSTREQAAAKNIIAMDYGLARNTTDALSFVEATSWPGFPALALLAQLPEYRTMHETLADEVVRTWGQILSTSKDEGATDKIAKLTQALERYDVRSLIRTSVIHDQAFGGAHIFPRLKGVTAFDVPLLLERQFVQQGSLESFAAVEPMWVTPNAYNATDPTKPHFYKPQTWYMLSKTVHTSRLYTMVSRPVSDMLKAAYSFRGVSISQLAMPYVDNWLRTRQSVSDTVKQFSITFLSADLTQMLAPGGAYSLEHRAQLFNLYRDNRNLAIIDKAQEEFGQINTPLSGLDALQAQAQEQMSAVSHIPFVKAFGITPAGLNANSDGEIRVWYDYVAGWQTANASPLMKWILDLIQLSEFGEVDPGISWDWNPLYELTDLELAEVRYKNADTDRVLIEAQVIDGEDVRTRMANDPTSGYAHIMAERDELDEVEDIANAMLDEAAATASAEPQPQDDTDGQDPNQPDAEGAATPGRQSSNAA